MKTFTKGFVEKPTVGEKMHVVAFVLDSTSLDFLSKNVLSALWKMKSVVVERGTRFSSPFVKNENTKSWNLCKNKKIKYNTTHLIQNITFKPIEGR